LSLDQRDEPANVYAAKTKRKLEKNIGAKVKPVQ
jgi:HAE1 family hydrophobic/amphiphilic exporter-1